MKVKKLDKKLKENWGLETLVAVGESWLPAMMEQDAVGVGNVWRRCGECVGMVVSVIFLSL